MRKGECLLIFGGKKRRFTRITGKRREEGMFFSCGHRGTIKECPGKKDNPLIAAILAAGKGSRLYKLNAKKRKDSRAGC